MNTLSKAFILVNLVLAILFAAFTTTLYAKRVDYRGKWEMEKLARQEDARDAAAKIGDLDKKYADAKGQLDLKVNAFDALTATNRELDDRLSQIGNAKFSEEENRKALEERIRAKDAELVRRHEQIDRMHKIVLKQQQALEVAKANQRTAENLKIEYGNELNNSRQQLVAIQREKGRLERDLQHQSWIVESLMRQGVPVNDIVQANEIQPATPISAKVLAVRPEVNLVMLSVGSDDGVRRGYRFTVYEGDKYVGKVEVEKVFNDMCSARILVDWTKQPIKENQDASTRVF